MTVQQWKRLVSAEAAVYGATVAHAPNGHLKITGDGWTMCCALTPRTPEKLHGAITGKVEAALAKARGEVAQ